MSILPKIEVPSYTLTVPSTKKQVTYRPYLVKEEKILLIALESSDAAQIRQGMLDIIKTCTTNLDMESLNGSDAEYIFIKLRAVSVGAIVNLTRKCDECDAINDITIDLENAEIKNVKDTKELRIDLGDKLIIDINFPNTNDNITEGLSQTDVIIEAVANSIDTIYYGEETYTSKDASKADMIDFVENLNTAQFTQITTVLLDAPYLGMDISYTCKECGHKHDMELRGLIDFFM